ncbi:hypothetical protein B4U79_13387, partial [Dinothrombium tinctorium]
YQQFAKLNIPVKHVIISHAETELCYTIESCSELVKNMQDFLMTRLGFFIIPYNFLVGADGRVYEAIGWRRHTKGLNSESISVVLIGDFNKHQPTNAMVNATLELIHCGQKLKYLTDDYDILALRDTSCLATENPGNNFYNLMKTWKRYNPKPIKKCK